MDYLDQNEAKFLGEKPDLEAEDRAAKNLLFQAVFQEEATKKVRGIAAKFAKLQKKYSEDSKNTRLVNDTRQSVDIGELCAEMRKRLRNWSDSGYQHLFTVKRKERANRNVDYTLTKTGVEFPDPFLEMLEKLKIEEENVQKKREEWALAEEKYRWECYERSRNLLKSSTGETSKEHDGPESL